MVIETTSTVAVHQPSTNTSVEAATSLLSRFGMIKEVRINDTEFLFTSQLPIGNLIVAQLDNGKWSVTFIQKAGTFSDRGFNLPSTIYRVMAKNPSNLLPTIHLLNPIDVYAGQVEYHRLTGTEWTDLQTFWSILSVEQQSMLGLYLLQLKSEYQGSSKLAAVPPEEKRHETIS